MPGEEIWNDIRNEEIEEDWNGEKGTGELYKEGVNNVMLSPSQFAL